MNLSAEAHGILAHYFCADEASRTQGALTPNEFARGLDAYGRRLISAWDWIDRALAGRLTDEVCVTIDDGLREAYEYALPVLRAFNITAAWNVYTQPMVGEPHSLERWRWVRNHAFGSLEKFYEAWERRIAFPNGSFSLEHWDRLMRWSFAAPHNYLADRAYLSENDRRFRYWRNEVASPREYEAVMTDLERQSGAVWFSRGHWLTEFDLIGLRDAGHVIGLHGHRHPTVMSALSQEDQRVEYATCKALLSGFNVTTASYPCGQMTDTAVEWFKANGIQLAWGATMKGSIPWECPRLSTGYWT